MTAVTLAGSEVTIAREVARMRDEANVNVVDRRADAGVLADGPHWWGVVGELAFAKWWNVWPDLTCYPRAGTPDFVVEGLTWDVKATPVPNGELICPTSAKADAQMYALAIVRQTGRHAYAIRFPGWATRAELIGEHRISTRFPKPCYAIPQAELHSWEEVAA